MSRYGFGLLSQSKHTQTKFGYRRINITICFIFSRKIITVKPANICKFKVNKRSTEKTW